MSKRVVLVVITSVLFSVCVYLIVVQQNRISNGDTNAKTNIIKDIDDRVSLINNRINYDWYNDYYDGDIVMYRQFYNGVEGDSLTVFFLYYDEEGKLIYADIGHYRAADYSIYFHNNVLLYVQVGPFYSEGKFINGDINDVQVIITEDPIYTFVLEDLAFCLSHAYQ